MNVVSYDPRLRGLMTKVKMNLKRGLCGDLRDCCLKYITAKQQRQSWGIMLLTMLQCLKF